MKQTAANLQQLKGVGSILIKRFQEAGLDNFAKIAQASEEDLKKVKGINPRNILSIKEQAEKLADGSHPERQALIEAVKLSLGEIRDQIKALAEQTRQRIGEEELAGKCGRKLNAELVRLEDTLANLKLEGKKGARRSGKALKKVHKRVTGIAEDASVKKVRKTLKRARKAARKAVK